jgi:RNA polymerase sigma factor (sigma-70 family)
MRGGARPEPVGDELLASIYQSLLRYWLKQRVSRERAEDLAQEGVVKCLLGASKWKGRASLKTFLITVGKNGGKDYLRREARQERIKQKAAGGIRSPGNKDL